MDQLTNSMKMRLGCVDHKKAEACSISLVPDQLRKFKEKDYMPHVVSIGPLHERKRTDLLYMEEVKWRCMLRLLRRSKLGKDDVLCECRDAMWAIDEIVRASYNVDQVKFNKNDLAKIMVLDGCFLLELLISGSSKLKEQINSSFNDNNDDDSPGAQIIKREKVLSDLTMLENQIPLVVLDRLCNVLFPQLEEKVDIFSSIYEAAFSILGYSSPDLSIISSTEFKAFNFLQLVHLFIDKEKPKASKDVMVDIDGENERKTTAASINHSKVKVKLQRCATKLEAAGVTIVPSKAQSEASNTEAKNREYNPAETRFDLRITFNREKKGMLEIPQLHITETTEAKWRNLIAWEVNRTNLEKQRGEKAGINCQFISYAWFIQDLLCCVHDVKLLREKNVIVVYETGKDKEGRKKAMSDEDLLYLFRKLTEGVSESDAEIEMDSWFAHVIQQLNQYSTIECFTATIKILWHAFRCFLTWIWYKCRDAYGVLRRVYIPSGWKLIALLAAAAGLGLTIAQTVFSAIGR